MIFELNQESKKRIFENLPFISSTIISLASLIYTYNII